MAVADVGNSNETEKRIFLSVPAFFFVVRFFFVATKRQCRRNARDTSRSFHLRERVSDDSTDDTIVIRIIIISRELQRLA